MPIYTCKSTVLFSDYQNMKPIYRALNVKNHTEPVPNKQLLIKIDNHRLHSPVKHRLYL